MDISAVGKARLDNLVFDCDLEIFVHRFQGVIASVSIELKPILAESIASLEGGYSAAQRASFSGVVYNSGWACGLRPMPFARVGGRLIGQIEAGKELGDYLYLIPTDKELRELASSDP